MNNKICLVTGANTGIGLATAKALGEMGARVVISCRSEEKARETLEAIHRTFPQADLDYALADLSSQQQIRDMAARLKKKYAKLDVLINNACCTTECDPGSYLHAQVHEPPVGIFAAAFNAKRY